MKSTLQTHPYPYETVLQPNSPLNRRLVERCGGANRSSAHHEAECAPPQRNRLVSSVDEGFFAAGLPKLQGGGCRRRYSYFCMPGHLSLFSPKPVTGHMRQLTRQPSEW